MGGCGTRSPGEQGLTVSLCFHRLRGEVLGCRGEWDGMFPRKGGGQERDTHHRGDTTARRTAPVSPRKPRPRSPPLSRWMDGRTVRQRPAGESQEHTQRFCVSGSTGGQTRPEEPLRPSVLDTPLACPARRRHNGRWLGTKELRAVSSHGSVSKSVTRLAVGPDFFVPFTRGTGTFPLPEAADRHWNLVSRSHGKRAGSVRVDF